MGGSRHLSWQLFEELIDAGAPAVEPVQGHPEVKIFTDAGGSRIGVRMPAPQAALSPSSLVEIDISLSRHKGDSFVEVSTRNRALFRDFYAFACAVADRIQLDQMDVEEAIESALETWAALLQQASLLSLEKQLGLFGELWAVRRCAASFGWDAAVTCWKGPEMEEHDLSLGATDIEVKTTSAERRVHTISSLTQLVPNAGRPLHVMSVQLTSAGAAEGSLSLSELVAEVTLSVSAQPLQIRRHLANGLARAGWNDAHAEHYRQKWSLRAPLCIVPVDEDCPTITPALLEPLGSEASARILHVTYRVDLSGLGHEDGSQEFLTVLPLKEG